jgi:uncharacterized membrane protein YebE (DUF533 family)
MKKVLIVVVGWLLATVWAEGGTHVPPRAKVSHTDHRQHDRIADGVADRSLTPGEAHRLVQEKKRIDAMEKAAAADGVVTPAEKAAIERAQDKASNDIASERHDAQGAPGPTRNWRVWDPGVNARQVSQQLRIAQGVLSGSLTAAEVRQLESTEQSIRQMEAAMKSDGVLTAAERQQLQAALTAARQAIYAAKHNGIARPAVRTSLATWVTGGHLTPAEARELLAQLHRMCEILRLLGGAPLPPAVRQGLEQEYAQLASQIFE